MQVLLGNVKKQISHRKDICEAQLKTPSMFISLYIAREMFVFHLIHYLKTGKRNAFSSPSLISQQAKSAAKAAHGVCIWINEKEILTITMNFTYSWRRKAITGLRQVLLTRCAFPAELWKARVWQRVTDATTSPLWK